MLAASARAATIPPPDPWFAGEPIKYWSRRGLVNGATLADTSLEQVGMPAQPADGEAKLTDEFSEDGTAAAAPFDLRELVPDAIGRIERRGRP